MIKLFGLALACALAANAEGVMDHCVEAPGDCAKGGAASMVKTGPSLFHVGNRRYWPAGIRGKA